MTKEEEKLIEKLYLGDVHYIEFCSSCGEKLKCAMVPVKELKHLKTK